MAEGRIMVRRVFYVALIIAGLAFAVQGGEFGTTDLLRQKRQLARIMKTRDSLSRMVDSLKHYRDKVEHDPATQERIAREVFGMVRGNKELLYRFSEAPDSVKR